MFSVDDNKDYSDTKYDDESNESERSQKSFDSGSVQKSFDSGSISKVHTKKTEETWFLNAFSLPTFQELI